MNIEIWSDVACPWCYIGKRRFESALAQFAHRDEVEVIWRSYQLDPHAPRHPGKTVNEILAQKYGLSLSQAAARNDQVCELAAREGLEYHLETAQYGNTFDAHRLIHLAAAHHLQDAMEERLLRAYFTEGVALGDTEALIMLATDVGLEADEARAVLEGTAYADEVRADTRKARQLGSGGVPFFAIDEKYGVSGAQPSEVLTEVLEQVWDESHPLINGGRVTTGIKTCKDESCTTS
jgi:predicted DsbA family dithiol-disulfide isomerase